MSSWAGVWLLAKVNPAQTLTLSLYSFSPLQMQSLTTHSSHEIQRSAEVIQSPVVSNLSATDPSAKI